MSHEELAMPGITEAEEDALQRTLLREALLAARKRARMSQRALAQRMGTMTQSAISDLESGAVLEPQLSTLQRLARAIGLSLIVRMYDLHGNSAGELILDSDDVRRGAYTGRAIDYAAACTVERITDPDLLDFYHHQDWSAYNGRGEKVISGC
jgi:transcriptional regulator with XRE-family HTH domain